MLHNNKAKQVDSLTGKLATWESLVRGEVIEWASDRWVPGIASTSGGYQAQPAINAEVALLNRLAITPTKLMALLQAARVRGKAAMREAEAEVEAEAEETHSETLRELGGGAVEFLD